MFMYESSLKKQQTGLNWHQPAMQTSFIRNVSYKVRYTAEKTAAVTCTEVFSRADLARSVSAPYSSNPWMKKSSHFNLSSIYSPHVRRQYETTQLNRKTWPCIQLNSSHHRSIFVYPFVNAYLAHQTVRVWRVMGPLSSVGWDRGLWSVGCC